MPSMNRTQLKSEQEHSKTYKMLCAPSEDSEQPAIWVANDPKLLQAENEDSGQIARMRRLI